MEADEQGRQSSLAQAAAKAQAAEEAVHTSGSLL